jgi:uncharacterized membrane protein
VWDFLFKYPAGMFARGEITLGGSGWLYLALVLAAAVAIPTLLRYRRAARGLGALDTSVLSLTRTAAIALVVLALFQPVLTVANIVSQRNIVAILLDDSISMRIADQEGKSRAEFLREAFHPELGEVTKALSRRLEPRFFKFAADARALTPRDGMHFAGPRTDLGQALDDVRGQIDAQSLAALIVVSDGAVTRATPLNEKLSAYRAADVPITTVAVGQARFDRDIEVSAVNMPKRALKDSSVVADVVVTQRGFDNQTVKLLIEDDGQLLGIEEVTFGENQPERTIRTRLHAKEAGVRRLRFHVAPSEDEILAENNARESILDVDANRHRILYFEGEPRFELKFLRRAVAKDENLRVVSLVRTAESKYYRLGIDSPEELAEGFPKTAAELFGYEGLILGSVESSYFSPAQLSLIADFVSRRGGGLLVLGGRRALTQGGYGNTPVAELLPVVLDAKRVDPIVEQVNVQPTAAGYGHPIGQLAMDGARALPWDKLPPLKVLHPIFRAKPGAVTLLEGLAADLVEPLTVLAEQRFGRGRALVLNVQNAWTWQMHQDIPLEDQTHETLWRQLLRALVRAVPDAVSIHTSSEHPSVDETVAITAEVLDEAFNPRNDAAVKLVVHTPIGDRLELPMTWDASRDGEYRLELRPEHAGVYEMSVEARSGEELATAKLHLPVGLVTPDHYRGETREALLERIAEQTGGRFYRADAIDALADEMPLSKSGVSVQERLALWDMPVIFLLIITLLAFEWLYRRWRGLV